MAQMQVCQVGGYNYQNGPFGVLQYPTQPSHTHLV